MRSRLALLLVVALAALDAGEVAVALRPQVVLATERATLGEVAELSGDAGLIAVIRDLPVQELPDLGEHRLEPDGIRRALGRGLGPVLRISGTCLLSRSGRVIPEAELVAAAAATVLADGDELTVTTLRAGGAVTIPAGGADTVLQAQPLDAARCGDLPFRVRVLRGEVEVARALVTLRVVRLREVAVAARALRRGERIGAGDVRTQRLPVARGWGRPVASGDLVGQEARVDLAEGTPLTEAMVSQPPAIRSGQDIVLLVSSERFQLTAKGQALNDGRIGETINVRRTADGRSVRGTVVAEGQVRLEH